MVPVSVKTPLEALSDRPAMVSSEAIMAEAILVARSAASAAPATETGDWSGDWPPTSSSTSRRPLKFKALKSSASCCDSTGLPRLLAGTSAEKRTASVPTAPSSSSTLLPTWVA